MPQLCQISLGYSSTSPHLNTTINRWYMDNFSKEEVIGLLTLMEKATLIKETFLEKMDGFILM